MFKHANAYVPGARVRVLPVDGQKQASASTATLQHVDLGSQVAFVRFPDGVEATVRLDRIRNEGEPE